MPQHLRAVSRTQGNNRALKQGELTPRSVRLDFEEVPVLVQAFRRMVRGLEFDVCEMAATTYLCARQYGKPFTALPVFLVRGFHHGAIVTSPAAGVEHPKQLEGRAVGVSRGYTVTTGVWARGILRAEYGVDLDAVTWVLSGDEHVEEYRPPGNVVRIEPGRTLDGMLATGELAAAIGVAPDPGAGIAPLVPDPDAAGLAALRARGHYPVNHLVVVRDELLDAQPDLAADLLAAFTESKNRYVEELANGTLPAVTPADVTYRRVLQETGRDPLPYGVEQNRAVLAELIDHAVDQHILTDRPDVDTLFAEGTRS